VAAIPLALDGGLRLQIYKVQMYNINRYRAGLPGLTPVESAGYGNGKAGNPLSKANG